MLVPRSVLTPYLVRPAGAAAEAPPRPAPTVGAGPARPSPLPTPSVPSPPPSVTRPAPVPTPVRPAPSPTVPAPIPAEVYPVQPGIGTTWTIYDPAPVPAPAPTPVYVEPEPPPNVDDLTLSDEDASTGLLAGLAALLGLGLLAAASRRKGKRR